MPTSGSPVNNRCIFLLSAVVFRRLYTHWIYAGDYSVAAAAAAGACGAAVVCMSESSLRRPVDISASSSVSVQICRWVFPHYALSVNSM